MLCRAAFVVFRHLRAVKAGLRVRGSRETEREHAEHVQASDMRGATCRNCDVTDIVGRRCPVVKTSHEWSDEQCMFAAGFSRFGFVEKLGPEVYSRDSGRRLLTYSYLHYETILSFHFFKDFGCDLPAVSSIRHGGSSLRYLQDRAEEVQVPDVRTSIV